jgi:hypothetical protein
MPLLYCGRNRARQELATARMDLLESELERLEREFEHNVYMQVQEYRMNRNQLEIAARADTVAQKRYEVTQQRYMIGRISITDNKLTVDAPKLTGFTQDRRPYSVTAESAMQDLSKTNVIELSGIHGQVELANRGETSLRAKTGIYDMKAGVLRLSEGIEIGSTGGYQISLTDALVNCK